MHIILLYAVFGRYHLARLRACQFDSCVRVSGIELVDQLGPTGIQGWRVPEIIDNADYRITIFRGVNYKDLKKKQIKKGIFDVLDSLDPDVIAIPGYSACYAKVALKWSLLKHVPTVLLSASQEIDQQRRWWREWIKSRMISLYSAALVGGIPQGNYLASLGMPKDRIFSCYDVVDNEFFNKEVAKARQNESVLRRKYDLPKRFLLASTRFIERKNLIRLVRAYAQFRQIAGAKAWKLVLLGDGPLKYRLLHEISELGLDGNIRLPGFKNYHELPVYYGLAEAFVHASQAEQWGLVVNEAMAAGLPVLVSNRCGCAKDLVQEGINGFTFNPLNVTDITEKLVQLWSNKRHREAMSKASREIISEYSPDIFHKNLVRAATTALSIPIHKSQHLSKAVLNILNLKS